MLNPGILTEKATDPTRIRVGSHGRDTDRQVIIDSAAVDSGNSPTTTLRKGLAMGKVTATKKWKQYDDGASDGTEVCAGVLADEVDMLLSSSDGVTAVDSQGIVIQHGALIEDNLHGLDANGKADLTHVIFR